MTDITTKPVSTARLKQIAHAIAGGNYRELTMRIPAEPDRDADLVISAAADEIDRLRVEVASLRRALWWLHSATCADLFCVGDEDRDIHEEALEIAFDRGADDTTPDDYIAALVVLSDESAALTEGK